MERRGHGHGGNKTNVCPLTPFIGKMKPFALELLEERESRKRQKAKRQWRTRPVLHLVRSKKL